MKPDPPSALAVPYASAAPAAGMTGQPPAADQAAPPAARTITATRDAGDDARPATP